MARKKRKPQKSKRVTRARRRKRSWRLLKGKPALKRRLRLLGLSLIVVFATIAVFATLALYQFFKTPLAQASGSLITSASWDGQSRFNLALVLLEDLANPTSKVERFAILSLNPYGESLTLASLPVEAEVEVPGGQGKATFRVVYALGEISAPKQNISLLVKTASQLLALPLDGYLLTDEEGLGEMKGMVGKQDLTLANFGKEVLSLETLKNFPSLLFAAKKNVRTNLSLPDLFAVARFLLKVRFDRAFEIEISTSLLEREEKLDRLLRRHFSEGKLEEEREKILVLNGTTVSGLAKRAARMIENLGGEVLDVRNAPEQNHQQGMIVAHAKSYTAKRIARLFGIRDFRSLEILKKEPHFNEFMRADIVLILGLDNLDKI